MLILLGVFAAAWRYGSPGNRDVRNAAIDATTRRATTTTRKATAMTSPGYGRREVESRPWDELREVTNSVGITLREIPRTLGLVGNACDPDGDAPPRVVRTQPFFLATTEVTRAQWKLVCGPFSDPSIYSGPATLDDTLPVNNIDFPDAIRFCRLLSAREGRNYRLPTEYEWEIACWGRRTRAIFATRAAMALANRVSQPDFGAADKATQQAMSDALMNASIEAAERDLERLGYTRQTDLADVALAELEIRLVHVQAMEALRQPPLPRDPDGRRFRVYDMILPKALPELGRSAFARGTSAYEARGRLDLNDAYIALLMSDSPIDRANALANLPRDEYSKYQANWWRGRDPKQPQGHPFGMQDMLGGLMEWTASPTMPYPMSMDLSRASAQEVSDLRFDEGNIPASRWASLDELQRFAFNRTLRDQTFYVVRGGSFERAVESCSPWNRYGQLPLRTRFTAHRENLGFRVALEP